MESDNTSVIVGFIVISLILIFIFYSEFTNANAKVDLRGLCIEKGYEGIVDRGHFLREEWHCYKIINKSVGYEYEYSGIMMEN